MATVYRNDFSSNGKRNNNCFRPKSRHYDEDLLFNRVREYILKYDYRNGNYISKEKLAAIFKVKVGQIEQCLHKLKLEGLVSSPIHHAPHDSQREPWGFKGNNGWQADIYYILAPKRVLKDLQKGKLNQQQRETALGIIINNSEQTVEALKSLTLNKTEEQKLLNSLLKTDIRESFTFFDKYDEQHRKELIDYAVKNRIINNIHNLLCNNKLSKSERKKLFDTFSDIFLIYNPYNHHFVDYVKDGKMEKFEKEMLIIKILKYNNFQLAKILYDCTQELKVSPKLQNKLEDFILVQTLIGEL